MTKYLNDFKETTLYTVSKHPIDIYDLRSLGKKLYQTSTEIDNLLLEKENQLLEELKEALKNLDLEFKKESLFCFGIYKNDVKVSRIHLHQAKYDDFGIVLSIPYSQNKISFDPDTKKQKFETTTEIQCSHVILYAENLTHLTFEQCQIKNNNEIDDLKKQIKKEEKWLEKTSNIKLFDIVKGISGIERKHLIEIFRNQEYYNQLRKTVIHNYNQKIESLEKLNELLEGVEKNQIKEDKLLKEIELKKKLVDFFKIKLFFEKHF